MPYHCRKYLNASWVFIANFLSLPQPKKCILISHLKCMGIWSYILEYNSMCGTCLFCVHHYQIVACNLYSWLILLLQPKESSHSVQLDGNCFQRTWTKWYLLYLCLGIHRQHLSRIWWFIWGYLGMCNRK